MLLCKGFDYVVFPLVTIRHQTERNYIKGLHRLRKSSTASRHVKPHPRLRTKEVRENIEYRKGWSRDLVTAIRLASMKYITKLATLILLIMP
jgi:hypothetical protein